MSKKIYSKQRNGFTLLELLIIIAVLAILSVTGFIVYNNIQAGARDARRRADLDQLRFALIQYYNQNKFFPPANGVGISGFSCGITISSWGNCDLLQQSLVGFISPFPYDPLDGKVNGGNTNCLTKPCYYYHTPDPKHSKFYIGTHLEGSDIPPSPVCEEGFGGGSVWNYCLSYAF